MHRLLTFLKYLSIDLSLIAIICTFTFSTYPSNVFAIDENGGVYQPGKDFDDALAKTNESGEGTGVMGMVEQFVGLGIAAAAISSLKHKISRSSELDCPDNKSADITLRLLQAGGLAYLLGELKAKSEFKKASKLATDQAFSVKTKEGEETEEGVAANEKQLESYKTLIKVYDHKVKGIETKKKLATLAELAYLGALGLEMYKLTGYKKTCSETRAEYTTKKEALNTQYATLIGVLNTEKESYQGTQCSVPGIAASPPCPGYPAYVACENAVNNVTALQNFQFLLRSEQDIQGQLESRADTLTDASNRQSIAKSFFNFKNIMIFLAVGALMKSSSVDSNSKNNVVEVKGESRENKVKHFYNKYVIQPSLYLISLIPFSFAHAAVWEAFQEAKNSFSQFVKTHRSGWKVNIGGSNGLTVESVDETTVGASQQTTTVETAVQVDTGAGAAEVNALNDQLATANTNLAAAESRIGALETNLAASESQVAGLQGRLASVEGQLADAAAAEARLVQARGQQAILDAQAEAARQLLATQLAEVHADQNACPGACNACSGFTGISTARTEAEDVKIYCCGVDMAADANPAYPNGFSFIPTAPGKVGVKTDVEFGKIPLITNNELMKFLKPAILNVVEHLYFSKYESIGKNANTIIAEHAAFYKYLDDIEENFESKFIRSHQFKKMDQDLAKLNYDNDSLFEIALSKIVSELSIQNAEAIDFSGVLGFGIKLFLITKLAANFFRTKALKSPKNRIYTFGTIAALNGLIVMFQGKRLKDNEKQRDVIKSEMERFANSHALKTGLGIEEAVDGNGNLVNIADNTIGSGAVTGTPTLACAAGSAGAFKFSPAPCPARPLGNISNIPRGTFSNRDAKASPLLSSIPGLVNGSVTSAASGLDQSNPARFNAELDSSIRPLSAVKKEVEKLAEKLDKIDALALRGTKGKKLPNSLSRSLANIRKSYSTGSDNKVSDSPLTDSAKDSIGEILDTAEKSGQANGKPLAVIPSGSPTRSGSDPFDFGDTSNGGIIENYDQYQADLDYKGQSKDLNYAKGEINQNENVSIFKVLNNRYLKSYDRLLTELPDREPERAPVPQE